MITFLLLVIGGLNWLLVGAWDINFVEWLGMGAAKWVYILVGLSAIWELVMHGKSCRYCRPNMGGGM